MFELLFGVVIVYVFLRMFGIIGSPDDANKNK